MPPRKVLILSLLLVGLLPIQAQAPREGLTRLSRAQAKAEGRSIVLDGSVPMQDEAGAPLDGPAVLSLLQAGAHTVDLFVDAGGRTKLLVVRPKTEDERKAPRPATRPSAPLPTPTAEDYAKVESMTPRLLMEGLLASDQGHRKKALAQEDKPLDSQAVLKGAAAMDLDLDARNQRLLVAYVERKGWPTKALVGEEGMMGAFLVLQHAPLSLQEQWLPKVQDSVARGDLPASTAVLLEDRVLMHQGKPQRYGTQSVLREGRLWIWPIEEPATVDARRKSVGLPPLAEQLKSLGLAFPKDVYPLAKPSPAPEC